jgi:RNA polymerase sigma-70 factor (ECF subfamily)
MNDTGQHIDLELIHLVKNGDAHAYESLVRRHYDMVYSLAFHWLKSKEAAEDLTQDLFIKLSHKLNLFNERSSFKTWFYRVVINMIKDYLKKIDTVPTDPECDKCCTEYIKPSTIEETLNNLFYIKIIR